MAKKRRRFTADSQCQRLSTFNRFAGSDAQRTVLSLASHPHAQPAAEPGHSVGDTHPVGESRD